jgi:succinate dehydrogenase flavin-adding protein (antitoxin of CptAB toxin-antitoxin module)
MTSPTTLSSVMQSLIELTRTLCTMIESNDLQELSKLLEQRDSLLHQQQTIVQRWDASKGELKLHIGSSILLLQQLDRDFVTLFTKKKEEAAEQLKQATNQRLLLAYSR